MAEKLIDARGLLCPKPLIMVKKALTSAEPGSILEILIDNATAHENVMRFLQDFGCRATCVENAGVFTVSAEVVKPAEASLRPEDYCSPAGGNSGPYILVLSCSVMGSGSDELGRILIQACINSLKETAPAPSAILFYNSGVTLACEGSPVLGALKELEAAGVKMLVCGTCLDYFELKPKLQVGRVSNMYDIMQTAASASKVFTP
ncbi:MAG TPA: sulfurtransferase-like selenium metabolism protein YedF [Candidatus Rifleibacterium sp.]|nr:sulfurtransferase-like selenium metabolism protein YedF [Candidatus Rifleibacterium sp.]HPW59493.1 sulfurtransferase-like selenium metabolism protein YedF [Candidatus Rifleibacterium sp.]HQB83177.1 sulfurtransferase-like selenium metabolism protein YedF [Candidatus Rifleibacterium sp.]